MTEDSYIKLPSAQVIDLCEKKLERIKQDNTREWQEAIKSFKHWRYKFKSCGFFWLKTDLTDQEYKKIIANGDSFWRPSFKEWGEYTCRELIRAAKITDYVYISMSDYQEIR